MWSPGGATYTAIPRSAFDEHETSAWIADKLEAFDGLAVERPTETSVLARLSTGRPGPTVALRADIDALPIHEESGVDVRLRAARARCTRAGTTGTRRCCSARPASWRARSCPAASCASSSSTARSSLPAARATWSPRA